MTKIIEGAEEALAIAKGEQPAAAIWHNGFKYVPSAKVEGMREALRRLIDTYKDMQDGDGNPCPDVAFAREVLGGRE